MNISSNIDAIAYEEEELDAGSDVTPKWKPFSIKDGLPETLKAIQALQTHQHDRRARGSPVASSRPHSNDAKPYGPETPSTYDFLVRARTGTGKTLTFLVPIIEARVRAVENARQKRVLEDIDRSTPRRIVTYCCANPNKRDSLHLDAWAYFHSFNIKGIGNKIPLFPSLSSVANG
ncbi:hypothetical protein ARMGADRAFT_1086482 [Armillaria gallica]|uniref:DEAD/DEAH box helicase domain-containing protein n=1 Tax=Armillaria gallica TaxID=47427 RepID=A0A2H3CUA0_ARMGA|nr:hypothetical protein ARMGADRAFT_1086482 [Armillaria gallica]